MISIVPILTSCVTVYRPSTLNTPFITEQHQVQAAAHSGNNGSDLQCSYSPVQNIGVMFQYNNTDNSNEYQSSVNDEINTDYHKHRMWEAGIGYSCLIDNDSSAFFDIYGGYGKGRGSSLKTERMSEGMSQNYAGGNYDKFFTQAGLGMISSENFLFGFHFRLSYVKYNNMEVYDVDDRIVTNSYIQDHQLPFHHLFGEPALTVRTGYKWIKFNFQAGLSLNFRYEEVRAPLHINPLNLSMGIVADIKPGMFKKQYDSPLR